MMQICLIIALVLFILAGIGVSYRSLSLGWLGLAAFTLGFLLGGY